MANAIEFESIVSGGHLSPLVRGQIGEAMRRAEGKRLKVKLQEVKRHTTTPQRKYYFGVVVPMVKQMFIEAGNMVDSDEVHDYLKEHVGKLTKYITLRGESKKVVRSIMDTETPEFSEYLEVVWAWAASMGLSIPHPSERSSGAVRAMVHSSQTVSS